MSTSICVHQTGLNASKHRCTVICKTCDPYITQLFHFKNLLSMRMVVATPSNVGKQRRHSVSVPQFHLCCQRELLANPTVAMGNRPNVCTRFETLRNYIPRTWMRWAHTTTTTWACIKYKLPKPDASKATVSANVHSDVKLYQPEILD